MPTTPFRTSATKHDQSQPKRIDSRCYCEGGTQPRYNRRRIDVSRFCFDDELTFWQRLWRWLTRRNR